MVHSDTEKRSLRVPLTRPRIVAAALALIDDEGLPALNMRRLGASLDVKAMALYKHFTGKEAMLDGIVEAVLTRLPRQAMQTTGARAFARRSSRCAPSCWRIRTHCRSWLRAQWPHPR